VPDASEILSAKSKLSNLDNNFHLITVLAQSIKNKNRNPDMLQPSFKPDFTSNHLVRPVSSRTEHWLPSYTALTISTSFSGIPTKTLHDYSQDFPVNTIKGILIVYETFIQAGISFKCFLHNVFKDKDLLYHALSLRNTSLLLP